MYKNRNSGTGNAGSGEMLYSGECPQTFLEISSNIPGNVTKHSGECPQTFRGMSSNIPGNVPKHSDKFPQTFRDQLVDQLYAKEVYFCNFVTKSNNPV